MKTVMLVVVGIIGTILFLGLIAYAVGATLPVDHIVSITGTVAAPPAKVFAVITDVAAGPTWRPEVKSVQVLPKDSFRDAWIEDMGSGTTMKFIAITTAPPGPNGKGDRKVETKDPDYGGTWDFQLAPGPTPGSTTLTITEEGYITKSIYRFIMAYVLGPTHNLDVYMKELQADVAKS